MTPTSEMVKIFVEQIKPELLWMLAQASVVAIVGMVFFRMYQTIAAYISFRSNRDIGKNVKIMVKNREAIITHFTMRFIFIRFKDNNNEMIMPMRKWEDHDWELIKNGQK